MVDFKKLREAKAKPKPINPRDIFNASPKPPGINDLYASQAEVLDAWFGRRTDRDIVVKAPHGWRQDIGGTPHGAVGDERDRGTCPLSRPDQPASGAGPREERRVWDPCCALYQGATAPGRVP